MHHTLHPRFRAIASGHSRRLQPVDTEGHPCRIVRHAGGKLSLQRVGGAVARVAQSMSHTVHKKHKSAKKKVAGSVHALRRALRK